MGGAGLNTIKNTAVDLSNLVGHTGGQKNNEGQKNEYVGQKYQEPRQRSQAACAQEVQKHGPQNSEHKLHKDKNKSRASDKSDNDRNHS